MVTETTTRNKPSFHRKDTHKMIKLGSTVKKNRKWRFPIGRHNKLRTGVKGHQARPKIGWGADNKMKGTVEGVEVVRVENVKALENVGKNQGIIIASVGKKKANEIKAKANEMKIKILNKYKPEVAKE